MNPPPLSPDREDGYGDGYGNVFQGVRVYDPTMAQWTAPDAYAGDAHDPMSQKPFMWNGNNPLDFGDPSGYTIHVQPKDEAHYLAARAYLSKDPKMKAEFVRLDAKGVDVYLKTNSTGNDQYDSKTKTIDWDPSKGVAVEDNNGNETGGVLSPAMAFGHEADHADSYASSTGDNNSEAFVLPDPAYTDRSEKDIIQGPEAHAASVLGEDQRENHFGKMVPMPCVTCHISGQQHGIIH